MVTDMSVNAMAEIESPEMAGGNNELLAVRVSPELLGAVRKLAEQRNRTVPEMVRSFLNFHLYPYVVDISMRRLKENGDARALESTLSKSAFVGEELERIFASCEAATDRVREIQDVALRMKERFEEIEREAETAWSEFVASLPDVSTAPQNGVQESHSAAKELGVGKETGAAKRALKSKQGAKERVPKMRKDRGGG